MFVMFLMLLPIFGHNDLDLLDILDFGFCACYDNSLTATALLYSYLNAIISLPTSTSAASSTTLCRNCL
jgi:hypothetical protein